MIGTLRLFYRFITLKLKKSRIIFRKLLLYNDFMGLGDKKARLLGGQSYLELSQGKGRQHLVRARRP